MIYIINLNVLSLFYHGCTYYTLHVLRYSLEDSQVGILTLTIHFAELEKCFWRLPLFCLNGFWGYVVKEQGYSIRILTIDKLKAKLRESLVKIISNQMIVWSELKHWLEFLEAKNGEHVQSRIWNCDRNNSVSWGMICIHNVWFVSLIINSQFIFHSYF